VLFDPKRRALHDLLAHTCVIYARPEETPPGPVDTMSEHPSA